MLLSCHRGPQSESTLMNKQALRLLADAIDRAEPDDVIANLLRRVFTGEALPIPQCGCFQRTPYQLKLLGFSTYNMETASIIANIIKDQNLCGEAAHLYLGQLFMCLATIAIEADGKIPSSGKKTTIATVNSDHALIQRYLTKLYALALQQSQLAQDVWTKKIGENGGELDLRPKEQSH